MEPGGHRRGWLRRLSPYLWAHRRALVLAVVASAVSMTVLSVVPVVQRDVVDEVVRGRLGSLGPLVLVLVGLGLLRFGATFVRRFMGGRLAFDVQYDLRTALFDHLHALDLGTFDRLQVGQLVSRANGDLSLIQQLLAWGPLVLGSLLQLLVSIAIMLALSWELGLLVLTVPVATFLVAMRMREAVFPSSWDAQAREAEMTTRVEEAVTGVRVVKGFGQEDAELGRLVSSIRAMFGARVRTVRLRARFSAHLQTIPSLGQLLVLVVGGLFALHGRLSLGTFVAFTTYLVQLTAPARMLAGILTVGQLARAGVERVTEVLDLEPSVVEQPGADDLPDGPGRVTFDHVTFEYRPGQPVLEDCSFEVGAGETVAIVGPSGSGKSTIGLLAARFYDPTGGAVLVDGVDVSSVTLASVRRRVVMAFESSFLFSVSLRDNIAFARPDVDDEAIVSAAEVAGAHGFVEATPDGYGTVVGEQGLTLSGGQRQRIALARAVLSDADVLVLDDATSAVDSRTEAAVLAALAELRRGRTTIMVAQRPSTLRLADRVLVLEDGRVTDAGSFDELFARNAAFRAMLDGDGRGRAADDPAPGIVGALVPPATKPARRRGAPFGPAGGTLGPGSADGGPGSADGGPGALPRMPGGARSGHLGNLGGGGFAAVALLGRPATDELQRRIDALPPVTDDAEIDVAAQAGVRGAFSLARFVRPWRRQLGLGLALVALDAAATLAAPMLVRYGVDRGVLRHSLAALLVVSGVFAAVALFDWWDMWAENVVTGRGGERMLASLRVRIFAHLQRLGLDYYERELAGRTLTRMTSDVDTLSNLLQTGLVNALVSLVTFVGIAALFFVMDVRLALVAMSVVPPLIVATLWFRRASARAYGRQREWIASVNAYLQESLSGIREVHAFRRHERNRAEFRERCDRYLQAGLAAVRAQTSYMAFSDLLANVAMALVLYVGGHLVVAHSLSIGELVAFLLYLTLFFSPIQQLSQVFDSYQQARAGVAKIATLLGQPVITPEPEQPNDPGVLAGHVRFEGVSFRYPGSDAWSVRGVDLDVRSGETLAVVGETGAGKSTLVKLLARFYDPTEGRVLVDGHDVCTLDLGAYRRQLGYVPQEPFLFSGTIRSNITYACPDADDAAVEAVGAAVGLDRVVARLPDGYDHAVSERGRSLSAGQRQLVCLARALLVDPAILVLDEATSNLDLSVEAAVSRAMEAAARGRTTILIAHRLQTARRADRIVVMHAGRVVEVGTHDSLVAAEGTYAALWQASSQGAPVA